MFLYQNPTDLLYYLEDTFINKANGPITWTCGAEMEQCMSFFLQGVRAYTLNYEGTGAWSGVAYFNGNADPNYTGPLGLIYFINGTQTELDASGTGIWSGRVYFNGNVDLNYTGPLGVVYFINGTQTELDSSGTGIWNGRRYENGVLQSRGILIYRKNAATPWIKQGDRLTKTFSSGLCLIQQTYIAPKALATYNAFQEGDAISDSQPCIDGAYIYPAPDYQDTGDGFMKCTVTAYGRWKTEPHVKRQKRKLELGVFGQIENMLRQDGLLVIGYLHLGVNKKEVLADDLVLSFVLPPDVDLPLTPPASLSRLYKLNGELIPQMIDVAYLTEFFGGYFTWVNQNYGSQVTITPEEFESFGTSDGFAPKESGISLVLTRCESVEYGHFSEYTASFEATGNSFTKTPFSFRKL